MIVQTQNAKLASAARFNAANLETSLFAGCRDVIGVSSIYQQNEEIYGEGEPADRVFRVARGVVRTYKLLDDGRRQIAAFYFPGDIFGLEPGETHGGTAEAVVTAQVIVFKRSRIDAAASQDIAVARELWSRAAQNLHHAESHMLLLGRKTAVERVEAFLIEMNQRGAASGHVNLPMTRRDIADYLGLTLETVSRALSQLHSEGGLELSSARKITLRSHKLLALLDEAA